MICGTLIVSPSPKWVKYIGKSGLDFVFIDTEHVGLDLFTLSSMCSLYIGNELEKNDKNRLLFVNIESTPALENLDEILSVPGLDGIVIGPNDLSYSLGRPNDYDSEEFEETVVKILKKARAKGIAAGIHYMGGIDRQIQWAKKSGMNMVFHSGDMYIFMEQLRLDLQKLRNELGGLKADEGPVDIVI